MKNGLKNTRGVLQGSLLAHLCLALRRIKFCKNFNERSDSLQASTGTKKTTYKESGWRIPVPISIQCGKRLNFMGGFHGAIKIIKMKNRIK